MGCCWPKKSVFNDVYHPEALLNFFILERIGEGDVRGPGALTGPLPFATTASCSTSDFATADGALRTPCASGLRRRASRHVL